MADLRKRAFTAILYPDSTSYNCEAVLKYISSHYQQFAYILHDMDVLPNDIYSDSGELMYAKGELKKPHYHVIFKFNDARTISSIAKELGLLDNDIEYIKSFKAQVRYLIHLDDPDKFQYSRESIVTNLSLDKFLYTPLQETEQLKEIVTYLHDSDVNNPYQLLQFICDNPSLYPAFRRNSFMINQCLRYNVCLENYHKKVKSHMRDTDLREYFTMRGFIEDDTLEF